MGNRKDSQIRLYTQTDQWWDSYKNGTPPNGKDWRDFSDDWLEMKVIATVTWMYTVAVCSSSPATFSFWPTY